MTVQFTKYDATHDLGTMLEEPLKSIEQDCRAFAKVARDLKLGYLWERMGLSWSEFCKRWLTHPPEFVEAVIAGVEAIGEEFPIPVKHALILGKHGRPKKGKEKADVVRFNYGNSTTYILARLDRDGRSDLADQVREHQLTGRAAAIEAGIIKPTTPLIRLRRAWKTASRQERKQFLAEI